MTYISSQKLREIKKELEKRKTILRQQISERIQEAQVQGDVTESAEYTEAKEVQAFNEGRIIELERLVSSAVIVSKKRRKDIIQIGSQIIVKDKRGNKFEFTIIGPEDANPVEGKISNESPLGQAFLNHRQGEEVEVQTPKGKIKYTIIRIK